MAKKTGKRTSAAEIGRRVDDVIRLIAAGLTRRDILQYVAEKATWKAAERTVDNYIARANDVFALEAGYSREKEIGKAKRRLEMIFASSIKVMDFQRAISAQRELNALLGLYAPPAPQTVRIEGVDDAQLKVLVEAIQAQGKNPSEMFAAMLQVIAENAEQS